MNRTTIVIIVLSVFCFFVLIWCGVAFLTSNISGWHTLAKRYTTSNLPSQMKRCNCLFGSYSRYTGTVQYASTRKGLYLQMNSLFSLGHKPLFIPWESIKDYETGSFSIQYRNQYIIYKARFMVENIKIYIDQDIKSEMNKS